MRKVTDSSYNSGTSQMTLTLDSSLGVTPLSGAATANKPKCVEMLLSLGAKPLKSSRSNKVPVLQACLMGSIEVMKVLPSGADFWDSDPLGNGETPLFCAAQKGKDVAKVAIACGATISYEPKSTKDMEQYYLVMQACDQN